MIDKQTETIYSFENFHLDSSRNLLLRSPEGEPVSLTHKAFQVLLLLVENSGALVTKDDLMSKIWKDSFVEEANLTQTISVLRRILGETPNQHRFIVTETGKGYRFVAHVESNVQISYPSSAREVKAIAVLPFKNIESNQDNQLLGIGMADAIITKLSHLNSIVVRQTQSVMRYADSSPEALKVGRDIDVDAVLEGSIQKADGRIRVSVRLYRVSDGSLLWAENFDERDTDIFTLQDSISEKVAYSLSLELNPEERDKLRRRYTDNIEAYQLYNKGRFFWNNRSSDELRKSIAFYEQAIVIDQNYALAYAGLAESYVLLNLFTQYQDNEAFPKARQAAEKALSLDENLAEAHNALAMCKTAYEWDWVGAELEFKRAVAINPSHAIAHQSYGEFLAFMGRADESIVQIEKANHLDPQSLSTITALALPYLVARKYDEAIDRAQQALELDENSPQALFYLGRGYSGKGLYKKAIAEYQKAIQNSGGSSFFISALIYSLAKDGQHVEAEQKLEQLLNMAEKQPISNYVLARGFAGLGYKEKALEKLEDAFQEHASLMHVLKVDPNFDEMRDDQHFQTLLKRMGF